MKYKLIMNPKFEFEVLKAIRNKFLKLMDEHTESQLLTVPVGFNNNILWQIGHSVVSHQRLLYLRSGLGMNVSETYMNNFKIGTSPAIWTKDISVLEVKDSLFSTIYQFQKDWEEGIFVNYEVVQTSLGVSLNNAKEAFTFSNVHEAIHFGNAFAISKVVKSNI
jgi:hypothetical protein